ncbi:MAG: hypothetical protein PVI01_17490 [Gemmatimonadales bacterium]|jgi:hypothetical protein
MKERGDGRLVAVNWKWLATAAVAVVATWVGGRLAIRYYGNEVMRGIGQVVDETDFLLQDVADGSWVIWEGEEIARVVKQLRLRVGRDGDIADELVYCAVLDDPLVGQRLSGIGKLAGALERIGTEDPIVVSVVLHHDSVRHSGDPSARLWLAHPSMFIDLYPALQSP